MRSDNVQLKKRGYIEEKDLLVYETLDKEELLGLLNSKIATERTVDARLLSKYQDNNILQSLIKALVIEKKLYTKIALSESISLFGEKSVELLIEYLGVIGKNQHNSLPEKPFKKKNYPLPRDIIARTICKIGEPALKSLKTCLHNGERKQILEAIDAVGFISYYENNNDCFDDIIILFDKYVEDDLLIWKLIRALQAFSNDKSIEMLNKYTNSKIMQHQWEAKRSLEQISRKCNGKKNY